jgi:hypothetical protein
LKINKKAGNNIKKGLKNIKTFLIQTIFSHRPNGSGGKEKFLSASLALN